MSNAAELLATTLVNRERAGMGDAILNNNALTAAMLAKGRMKPVNGGRVIYETLAIAENSTGAWYNNYDTFTLGAPGQTIEAAQYDYAQLGGFAAISGREEHQNRERWQAEDLAETRLEILEKTLENLLGAALFNDGSVANAVDGLQLLVADDPTAAGTPGGIDQVANANWQNVTSGNVAGLAAANVLDNMNSVYTLTTRGKDQVDLICANSVLFNMYLGTIQDIQRVADAGVAKSTAGYGFQALKFRHADFIYDSNVPDGSGSGPITRGRGYFINCDTLTLRYAPDRRFSVGETRIIQNADYKATPVWFMGQLTCRDRARNAVLFDAT